MIIVIDYASVDTDTPPDWAKAQAACKNAGSVLGGVIFRGTYGTSPDPTVARDWKPAQEAGLVTGAYLYLRNRGDQPPVDQVHAFAETVTLTTRDFVPTIDVEDAWPSAESELAALHEAWVAMRSIYGVPPMLYDSNRVWTEDLHDSMAGEMIDSPQWVAKPWPWRVRTGAQLSPVPFVGGKYDPIVPKPWGSGNWWLHQFQGDAIPMAGFRSTVDLSRFHVMAEGETGQRVLDVQRRLGLPATGVFNSAMGTYLRSYQGSHDLVTDAIIGLQTFTRICWTPLPPR